jgi:hypothetical protein
VGQQIFCGEIPEAPCNCCDNRRYSEPDALRSLTLSVNVYSIDQGANFSLDFADFLFEPGDVRLEVASGLADKRIADQHRRLVRFETAQSQ